MATLDVTGVTAVGFPVDTTIIPPVGSAYILLAGVWIGIPGRQGRTMDVTPAGNAMCMLAGSYNKHAGGDMLQVMTVDEVRVSV